MKRSLFFYLAISLFLLSPVAFAQSPEGDLLGDEEPPVSAPAPVPAPAPKAPPTPPPAPGASGERLVSLDFDNVDLPVLVKFIGELTMKNFVIDEQVRGKVTLFSPVKIPISQAYDVFLSVLDMKGFKVVEAGEVNQIFPAAAAPPPRSIHVYTVQNTNAEDISKVLLGVVSMAAAPRRVESRSSPGKDITGKVDIITDKLTNKLIITASDEDYPIVEEMIKSLDTRRKQVYVEAVVLEMASEKLRQLGTDLGALFGYIKSDELSVIGGFQTAPPALVSVASTLLGAGTGTGTVDIKGGIGARTFLQALQSEPEVNVLSTPQILTTDRQKAEIIVGQNVPFPGAQSQTVGGNVQTTIERKDVGITLKLTPTILASNSVGLDLFQEISSVVDTASAEEKSLGPTTAKRSATTNVIVGDGQTVVIGGLIRDNLLVSTKKIPLLGSIPLLGWLFKTETKRIEKTNLLIFITPYIVPDGEGQKGLDAIRERKLKESIGFMEKHNLEGDTGRKETLEKMIPAQQKEKK
jgi:general secretion pathway protein D